jgi:hypothetical protein
MESCRSVLSVSAEGDTGGQWLEHGSTTDFAFQALVALHATVG